MTLRSTLAFVSLLLCTTTLWAQKSKKKGSVSSWRDTTFIAVKLIDTISDNRMVAVEVGRKATIFVPLEPMLVEAREHSQKDYVKEEYGKVIRLFDTATFKGDTMFINEYYKPARLRYLVAHQLLAGNAKVFYKKHKTFVDSISHRLERFSGNADRFFYLPDRRPFFAVREMMGILDDEDDLFSKGRMEAYVKEGEKLASLREE